MNDHDTDQFEKCDPQAWLLAVEGLFLDKAATVLGGVSGAEELERIRRDGLPSLGQIDLGHPMLETETENG